MVDNDIDRQVGHNNPQDRHRGAILNESHDDRRNGGQNGANVRNEVHQKGHQAPQQGKFDPQYPERNGHADAGNQADLGLGHQEITKIGGDGSDMWRSTRLFKVSAPPLTRQTI